MVKKKVKKVASLLLFLFTPLILWGQTVHVSASLEESSPMENQTLQGTITITHDAKEAVDLSSFTIDKNPFKPEFIKDVRVAADGSVVVSIYQFTLPPQIKGLHVLPLISVKVGEKMYQSIPSTFKVSESSQLVLPGEGKATLKLEQVIQANSPLYPGQKAKIIYRYIYSGNIELTGEKLPLLDPAGFRKVSDKQIKEGAEGSSSVQEITLEIQALKPGTFTFPPSVVEGLAYQQDPSGKRVYASAKLHAETQAATITVAPFPEEGKPTSFSGAIGKFSLKTQLLTPREMLVGDKIVLQIDIVGDPMNFETVQVPDLCCQPGFSGLFRQSDLLPLGSVTGNVKQFKAEMRPLSAAIKAIPPVEFSSFDPDAKKYLIQQSDPIPIRVSPSRDEMNIQTPTIPAASSQTSSHTPSLSTLQEPAPIEISGNFNLQERDLHNAFFGTWWVLLLIPVGLLLLLSQIKLKEYLEKKRTLVKPKTSKKLFQEALQANPQSSEFFRLLNQAFMEKLKEKAVIKSTHLAIEKLPNQGAAGQVRAFLSLIEKERFTGKEFTEARRQEAETLFKHLSE
jgi:hypothetical protein